MNENSTTILFAGDSITDCGRREDPDRQLGNGFVRIIADYYAGTGNNALVVNRGVGGNCASDLRKRWQTDVLDAQPDILTIFVGINETSRRFDRDDPTTAEQFEKHYRALLESTIARADPQLVLIEPFLTPIDDEQRLWLGDLREKRAVVGRLAIEFGAAFIPLHGILTRAAEQTSAIAITSDGVHPTPAGHQLIAESWLQAVNTGR